MQRSLLHGLRMGTIGGEKRVLYVPTVDGKGVISAFGNLNPPGAACIMWHSLVLPGTAWHRWYRLTAWYCLVPPAPPGTAWYCLLVLTDNEWCRWWPGARRCCSELTLSCLILQ